jgi:hypothetical protein
MQRFRLHNNQIINFMTETISYFRVYILPIICAFAAVAILTLFNYLMAITVLRGRTSELIEVLAYSITKAGPATFAISFLCSFYFFDFFQGGGPSAKVAAFVFLGLMFLGLDLDFFMIPRVNE